MCWVTALMAAIPRLGGLGGLGQAEIFLFFCPPSALPPPPRRQEFLLPYLKDTCIFRVKGDPGVIYISLLRNTNKPVSYSSQGICSFCRRLAADLTGGEGWPSLRTGIAKGIRDAVHNVKEKMSLWNVACRIQKSTHTPKIIGVMKCHLLITQLQPSPAQGHLVLVSSARSP